MLFRWSLKYHLCAEDAEGFRLFLRKTDKESEKNNTFLPSHSPGSALGRSPFHNLLCSRVLLARLRIPPTLSCAGIIN